MYSLYKNEYRILKLFEITMRKGPKWKEESRGNEPDWAIKHIYMEVPQGNSLCSFLKQANMYLFFLSENRRAEQTLPGGVDTSKKGRRWERV
jgi:hypothetical protein